MRVCCCLLILVLNRLPAAAQAPDFLRVAPDNFAFQTASGKRFAPMGAYYFDARHDEPDAMNWWPHFQADRVAKDFALAKRLGCNTLRLRLSLTVTDADPQNPGIGTTNDWRKCDTLLRLAKQNGLRLYLEANLPGHTLQDNRHLPLYAAAYRQLAARYKDDPTVFCWSLDSEAVVLVGYPGDKEQWMAWLKARYKNEQENARAWNFLSTSPGWRDGVWSAMVGALNHKSDRDDTRKTAPSLWYLDGLNRANDTLLYDWQQFREHLYTAKIKQIADAVRAADKNHLLALDLILWAFPLARNPAAAGYGGPYGYAATDVKALGKIVDFFGVHTYPQYIPAHTQEWYESLMREPRVFTRQLRYLATVCRYVRAQSGRPVVQSETGWHGGQSDYAGNSEEDQKRWCMALLAATKDCAVGFINWALKDVPTHAHPTDFSGLVTTDLQTKPDTEHKNPLNSVLYAGDLPDDKADRPKAWGIAFGPLAAAMQTDAARKFAPGKRVVLSRRLVLTADSRRLDALLQDCLRDENFPCDIVLEETTAELPQGRAALHRLRVKSPKDQFVQGDVRGRGEEIEDRVGDVLRLNPARLLAGRVDFGGKLRVHAARTDDMDADIVRPQLHRHHLRKRDDARLRRAVGSLRCVRLLAGGRSNVDDGSAPARDHGAEGGARAEKRATQIDVEAQVELVRR